MATCPNCSYDSPAGMRFCGQCGAALPAEGTRTGTQPERRVLTVMFCDLVGSTTLSESLDPEDFHTLIALCQGTWRSLVETHGGHVAQFLGDGLLAYFGYPRSREDDALRAVRTGLRIAEEMAALRGKVRVRTPAPLEVRIGIHSGPVVVGEIGDGARREQLALGTTPNLAARLQSLAEAGSVLISETTSRLLQGTFVCQELGPQQLKGFSQPMQVYRVVREGAGRPAEPFPLIGRQAELDRLLHAWHGAKTGTGQVVLVQGEAGVGKSRLVRQLTRELAREVHTSSEGHCSPYYQNTAFHPLAELLRKLLGLPVHGPAGPGREPLSRLEEALAGWGLDPAEHGPLWASLLSFDPGEAHALPDLTPVQWRSRLLASLVAGFSAISRRQPLLLIVQDLHWVDPSTIELLTQLAAQCAGERILVLLTARPGFEPPWPGTARIDLARLEPEEIAALVRQTAGSRELPPEVLEHLVERAEGVPLFAEELTKMVLESGLPRRGAVTSGGAPPLAGVPTTLQSSIDARLDRLGGAKAIAQTAAVLGQVFDARLMRALHPEEKGLDRYLLRLAEAEIVIWAGGSIYAFKHALIRDAVYESLLRKARPELHRSVARALEAGFPEVVETRPELLAQHYAAGELVEPAIAYWQKAGQRAAERSADLEASRHLAQALELLGQLPEGEERDRLELSLQTALGPTLMALKGYAAPEVEAVYRRALNLCEALKPTPHQFPVLLGMVRIHHVRADLAVARRLGEELVATAEEEGGPVHRMVAHLNLGITLFHLAELERSRRHLGQAVGLADDAGSIPQAFRYGTHPGFHGRAYKSYALWTLGFPDRALRLSDEAVSLARQLADPMSLSVALNSAAILRQYRREPAEAVRLSAEAMEVAREAGLALYLALSRMVHGWGIAYQGDPDAVAEVHRGVIAWVSTGTGVGQTYFLTLLAELHARLGGTEEALSILKRVEALTTACGEAYYLPEHHRLRGELLLASGSRDEAEASLRRACQVAHAQGAKSLYLRSATVLARLWRDSGRESEARKLLARAIEGMDEGFGTADFAGASALRSELEMSATR